MIISTTFIMITTFKITLVFHYIICLILIFINFYISKTFRIWPVSTNVRKWLYLYGSFLKKIKIFSLYGSFFKPPVTEFDDVTTLCLVVTLDGYPLMSRTVKSLSRPVLSKPPYFQGSLGETWYDIPPILVLGPQSVSTEVDWWSE